MTEDQELIIANLSIEISKALHLSEHYSHQSGGNVDEIEANLEEYRKRVVLLRDIRTQLENEFTKIIYDPR